MTATQRYCRNKPQGRSHRTKIRVLLLPRLRVGAAVPTGAWLGRWLRINPSEGWRHLRRVLAEDGYRTETRGEGRNKRTYIIEIPAMRAAA